jgi:protoporphyrinogen/coproporphyrinogen III oxidase
MTSVPRSGRPRVVVVGGGLTGLATAWHLRDDADVLLLEASDRLGGEIHTAELAGAPLDVGADAFLARQPEAEALVRAVGFGDEDLVAPATSLVYVWVRGRLRPLPDGTVLGAPTDLRALIRSGVLGPAGVVRAALEPTLPRRHVAGDRSVADLVGERFGRDVLEVLVDPLLGGVYAGRTDRLSAQAAAPSIWAAAQQHRSLLVGLAAHRSRTASDDRPVFKTLRGGLGRLVTRLADDLGDRVRTGVAATGLTREGDDWHVATAAGPVAADHVVLTVPARAAATLLAGVAPASTQDLATMRSASVAVVGLAYDPADAADVPMGSGFLVPRSEGRLIKAVTWSSRKWPHHRDRGHFLLRASVGRIDDPAALELDDDTLADRVDAEVRWATGIRAPARERLVRRWVDALPQYDVGHLARVDRIRVGLEVAGPGLHIGGAALDGLGLASRARDARRLADAVREQARSARTSVPSARS